MNDQPAMVLLKDNDRGSPKVPIQPGEPIRLGIFWSRNYESQRLGYSSYSEPHEFPVEFIFSRVSTFERTEKSHRKPANGLKTRSQDSLEHSEKAAEHESLNKKAQAMPRINSSPKKHDKFGTTKALKVVFGPSVMGKFAERPGLCVRITKKFAACTKRLAKNKHEIAETAIQHLSELRLPSQVEKYNTELKSIADSIFCHFHHPAQEEIDAKCERLLNFPIHSSEQDALPPRLLDQGQKDKNPIPTKVPLPQRVLEVYRYIQVLSSYKTKVTTKNCIQENLMRVISKPLTSTELDTGSIYVYWFQPNFGNRKIGWTRGEVHVRMRAWECSCKHHIELVYPSPGSKQIYVPHASRLEKLIHAELHAYRRIEERCKGCSKKHIEWSTATDEHIIRVIEKWTLWMEKKPYKKTIPVDASDID